MSDPIRQAQAAKSLVESLRAQGEDDQALLVDTVEGETSLFEAIDAVLMRMADDRVMVAGLEAVGADLETRKDRFVKRIEAGRALIEQAMMIADLPKVERPMATLSLATRQPKTVIETEADIPAEFWKPGAPTLDKKAVGEALRAGRVIPGAYQTNAAPSLTMRTK